MDLNTIAIVGLIGFVFIAWRMDSANKHAVKWMDRTSADIDEIVEWLKEIDPRFEQARYLRERFEQLDADDKAISAGFAAMDEIEYREEEDDLAAQGERTYRDPLRREWRKTNELL